ncbi:MAG: hypothetical protein L0312_00275 [Acidobacteria bacterium]|nr:hypothetical protein [Acidobacteriota bacterium]
MKPSKKPPVARQRALEKEGQLRLELVDVYGTRLNQSVDILLRHQQLTDRRIVRGIRASTKILVRELHAAPQGLYRIEVDPPAYLPVSQFVSLNASGITDLKLTFPVDTRKIDSVEFPSFQDLAEPLQLLLKRSSTVLAFEGATGQTLFDALDEIRKAGLLNIAAKAQSTLLANGKTVFPQVQRLLEVRGDRFFAKVPKQLREETKNSLASGLFRPANGALHHPPAGYTEAGSFKTEDRYGNLQLTFFMNGNDCVADIDIDDAAGLEHLFQVLRNTLTDRPTHPFDIHEILVFHQRIDPGYRFVV